MKPFKLIYLNHCFVISLAGIVNRVKPFACKVMQGRHAMDSGFQRLDCGFLVCGTWILKAEFRIP